MVDYSAPDIGDLDLDMQLWIWKYGFSSYVLLFMSLTEDLNPRQNSPNLIESLAQNMMPRDTSFQLWD